MNINFLDEFLIQSQTSDLQTRFYPKLIDDLKVKVSFGQGNISRVSWISFLGPEMKTSCGYYPVYLYFKKDKLLVLSYGISETEDCQNPWNEKIILDNLKIKDQKWFDKKKYRYGDSFIHKIYRPRIIEDKVRYFSDDKEILPNEISNDLQFILNEYKFCLGIKERPETSKYIKRFVNCRVGSKSYRDGLIKKWNGRCPITNIDLVSILISSHIFPYSDSNKEESLDVENGILLSPVYDQLFDQNLISFKDDGKILISDHISVENRIRLNLSESIKIQITSGMKPYLEKHREKFRKKNEKKISV